MRPDGRQYNELRPVTIQRHYTKYAPGSVLVSYGDTKVLCTAMLDERVPTFLKDTGSGWVTAEYAMLPAASAERVPRDSARKGRALEISRLIGRSLRCATDLKALGERQILIDCDVVQADGGTRTASITGAFVALHDAVRTLVGLGKLPKMPALSACAAVSVGIVHGEACMDLCYAEDSVAETDMNLVMCEDGRIIEIQGSAEREPFSREGLDRLIKLGEEGIRRLIACQKVALEGA